METSDMDKEADFQLPLEDPNRLHVNEKACHGGFPL